MNTISKNVIISFIAISLAFYLFGSFSNATFNITQWGNDSRSIYAGLGLTVWLSFCFFMLIFGSSKTK